MKHVKSIMDHTSNYTLKHFLQAPKSDDASFPKWIDDLKKHQLHKAQSIVRIAYQNEEKKYHARSFEDAFINVNIDKIKEKREHLSGIKNIDNLDTTTNIYDLTQEILEGKSDFASSILFLALSTQEVQWEIPNYIKEGLLWMAK